MNVNGYFPPPLATYIPQPYEAYTYAPHPPPPPPQAQVTGPNGTTLPLPPPQTNVGFPLDATRYYLLGQLEYYLSAQNMASDFYLRQQVCRRRYLKLRTTRRIRSR